MPIPKSVYVSGLEDVTLWSVDVLYRLNAVPEIVVYLHWPAGRDPAAAAEPYFVPAPEFPTLHPPVHLAGDNAEGTVNPVPFHLTGCTAGAAWIGQLFAQRHDRDWCDDVPSGQFLLYQFLPKVQDQPQSVWSFLQTVFGSRLNPPDDAVHLARVLEHYACLVRP